MKKSFFFVDKINIIIKNAIKEFESINLELQNGHNEILLKGLFAYQVSKFEILMNEILREFLNAFPEKIPDKNFSVSKKLILKDFDSSIGNIVDDYIMSTSYGNINNYINKFFEILTIDSINEFTNNRIIEMKETRNLLIHNDLKVNQIYLFKCKDYCRATDEDINKRISFDSHYVKQALDICIEVTEFISEKIREKYKEYTKIKAMKEIWEYLFNSPILQFDDYWEHDGTHLLCFKLDKEKLNAHIRVGYSGTEKLLMFFILKQYNDYLVETYLDKFEYRFLDFNNLYGVRKEKYRYLHDILFKYPQLFQQDL
ncbi:hypothetical protein ABES58_14015 [Paenibacillus lautus]|uniref:hypothetical protein n=1 Tax=Paenibacillus lautus TaxID=1401 RepID=UPI003D26C141